MPAAVRITSRRESWSQGWQNSAQGASRSPTFSSSSSASADDAISSSCWSEKMRRARIEEENKPASGSLMHPLDHPIWTALVTRQQGLAEGGALARRYPPEIAPFADLAEMSPEGFSALGALMSPYDFVVLFTPEPVTVPTAFKILLAKTGEQMIGTPANDAAGRAE